MDDPRLNRDYDVNGAYRRAELAGCVELRYVVDGSLVAEPRHIDAEGRPMSFLAMRGGQATKLRARRVERLADFTLVDIDHQLRRGGGLAGCGSQCVRGRHGADDREKQQRKKAGVPTRPPAVPIAPAHGNRSTSPWKYRRLRASAIENSVHQTVRGSGIALNRE